MDDIERVKERLDNIASVEPIISSMRTIAAGSWRAALRHMEGSRAFSENLLEVIADVQSSLTSSQLKESHVYGESPRLSNALVLVIASERGLCGSFNDTVLDGASHLIEQQQLRSETVQVITLGSRGRLFFEKRGAPPVNAYELPVTRLPSFEQVHQIGTRMIALLDRGTVDSIHVIYSPYKPAITLPPIMVQWLPIDATALPGGLERWPQPVVETDPGILFRRTVREWMYARLYSLVIESAASEQSARYRSMDAASTNMNDLIESLTQSYHSARQHAITMEMLDLVAGSGILRKPTGRTHQ